MTFFAQYVDDAHRCALMRIRCASADASAWPTLVNIDNQIIIILVLTIMLTKWWWQRWWQWWWRWRRPGRVDGWTADRGLMDPSTIDSVRCLHLYNAIYIVLHCIMWQWDIFMFFILCIYTFYIHHILCCLHLYSAWITLYYVTYMNIEHCQGGTKRWNVGATFDEDLHFGRKYWPPTYTVLLRNHACSAAWVSKTQKSHRFWVWGQTKSVWGPRLKGDDCVHEKVVMNRKGK